MQSVTYWLQLKKMKILITVFVLFIQFLSLGQSLDKRELITKEFESKSDVILELTYLNAVESLKNELTVQSNFLDSLKIQYKILNYRISAIKENDEVAFTERSDKSDIPVDFMASLNDCKFCEKIKVDLVTINWFTGTYTLKLYETFEIK